MRQSSVHGRYKLGCEALFDEAPAKTQTWRAAFGVSMYQQHLNVPLLKALCFFFGLLKGSWGVLVYTIHRHLEPSGKACRTGLDKNRANFVQQ